MNRCPNSYKSVMAAGLSLVSVMVLPVAAAPVTQPPTPEVVSRSVFVIPTNPKEGRDPYFPNSNRPYDSATAGQVHVADVSSLVLKGVSGPPDHRLAIINNHTFAEGDEQDLVTSQGRIHVHCVEIKNGAVVIETSGQRHELKYVANP